MAQTTEAFLRYYRIQKHSWKQGLTQEVHFQTNSITTQWRINHYPPPPGAGMAKLIKDADLYRLSSDMRPDSLPLYAGTSTVYYICFVLHGQKTATVFWVTMLQYSNEL